MGHDIKMSLFAGEVDSYRNTMIVLRLGLRKAREEGQQISAVR